MWYVKHKSLIAYTKFVALFCYNDTLATYKTITFMDINNHEYKIELVTNLKYLGIHTQGGNHIKWDTHVGKTAPKLRSILSKSKIT